VPASSPPTGNAPIPPAGDRPPRRWAGFFLALGLLADGALVALLIGISGFIFSGPEGLNGETGAVLSWSLALGVCLVCAVLALVFWRAGRRDFALAAAWLPALGFLAGAVFTL